MIALRIFISYESIDAAFAKQLTTDLRASGAEIIVDSPDLQDTALEQFLREKLSRCQQFLVIQTPEALQSPRMRVVLETALKYMQEGLITGVLRVIARTFDPAEVQAVPSLWATVPGLNASQDYPRALARLRSHLNLKEDNKLSPAPPPAASYRQFPGSSEPTETRKKLLVTYSSYTQESNAKDRPLRPFRHSYTPLRSRFILLSLALVLVLLIAGVTVFLRQSSAAVKPPSPTPTTQPSIDATKLTPTQLYDAVTSRPTFYRSSLSQQDNAQWDQGRGCQFTNSTYEASIPAQGGNVNFQACLEKTFLLSDFAFQTQMTILSGSPRDGAGLIFRAQDSFDSYRFRINLDGSYDLTQMSYTSLYGTSPAVKTGLNHTNLLTAIAQGSLIFLYINQQFIGKISNASADPGTFGFMAVSLSKAVFATFKNTQAWRF